MGRLPRRQATISSNQPPKTKIGSPAENREIRIAEPRQERPSYWGPALAIAVPLLALAGVYYQTRGAFDAKMVEIGINILSADPSKTDVTPARQWALELVEKYSGKPFNEEDKLNLLHHSIVPGITFLDNIQRPGGIANAGCKAWRKNIDGSWTQTGAIVTPGNNTFIGNTMKDTAETRLLDQNCK